eukprot:19384-Pelagomonas_calceolata.AAC.1
MLQGHSNPRTENRMGPCQRQTTQGPRPGHAWMLPAAVWQHRTHTQPSTPGCMQKQSMQLGARSTATVGLRSHNSAQLSTVANMTAHSESDAKLMAVPSTQARAMQSHTHTHTHTQISWEQLKSSAVIKGQGTLMPTTHIPPLHLLPVPEQLRPCLAAAACGAHRSAGTCHTWQHQSCQTCAAGSW